MSIKSSMLFVQLFISLLIFYLIDVTIIKIHVLKSPLLDF